MQKISLILFAILLFGCSEKIVKAATPSLFSDIIMKGFINADNNFHLAVQNGELAQDDPIIPCFDGLVGVQNPNAQPYNTDGPIELTSVAYIKINSIRSKIQSAGPTCDALIGKFTRDTINNAPVPNLFR